MGTLSRRQLLAGLGAAGIVGGLKLEPASASGAGYGISRQFEKDDIYSGGPLLILTMATVNASKSDAADLYDSVAETGIDTFIDSLESDDLFVDHVGELDFSIGGEFDDIVGAAPNRCGWSFDLESDGIVLDGYIVLAQKSRVVQIWCGVGLSGVERPFFRLVDRHMKFDATGKSDLVDIVPDESDLDGYTLTTDEIEPISADGWL